jgi:hypothetical protein
MFYLNWAPYKYYFFLLPEAKKENPVKRLPVKRLPVLTGRVFEEKSSFYFSDFLRSYIVDAKQQQMTE